MSISMSNLSRSILDRLMIHTSVTFDGMISAFWVGVDHPGSAPDMCYEGGNKKAKEFYYNCDVIDTR